MCHTKFAWSHLNYVNMRKCCYNKTRTTSLQMQLLCSWRLKHELHNHSSGVTCEWFSWPEDQSRVAYLCEHLLLSTKASAVRPTLCVADLQLPGRLRHELTQPQQRHCWTTSNTALRSELHYLTWKTEIHLSFQPDVWWNALTYMGAVQVWLSAITLMSIIPTVYVQWDAIPLYL